MRASQSLFLFTCIMFTMGVGSALWADGPFRTVSLFGDPATGIPGGTFVRYGAPSIDHVGNGIFFAQVASGLGTDGIWSEASGVLSPWYIKGTQAVDAPIGTDYGSLRTQTVNRNGEVAFAADMDEPGLVTSQFDLAVYSNASGTVDMVAREGEPAPGAPVGALFDTIHSGSLLFSGNGVLAFSGTMQNGLGGVTFSDNRGIWRGKSNATLSLVARQGDQAAGAPVGQNYNSLILSSLNEGGKILFEAFLSGTGVTTSNQAAIFSDIGGTLDIIARQGEAATVLGSPGTMFGGNFDNLLLNTNGTVAFNNRLEIGSGGVTSADDTTLWRGTPGSYDLIAREGAQAPGTPVGADFTFISSPLLNANDDIAFFAGLETGSGGVTSDNDRGLWSTASGSLDLVVRKGDAVPGVPGAVFSSISGMNMNDVGQLAFFGTLEIGTGGVISGENYGVWAQRPDGNIALVARAGDQIDVDDGPGVDLRTVHNFQYTGNTPGLSNDVGTSSFFNPAGQLAITISFRDGPFGDEGVFIWDSNFVPVVPEPTSGVLAISLALMASIKSRRRES